MYYNNLLQQAINLLDQCLFFTVKEFIIILFFVFQLGYVYGIMKKRQRKRKNSNNLENKNLAIQWKQQQCQNINEILPVLIVHQNHKMDQQLSVTIANNSHEPSITQSRRTIKHPQSSKIQQEQISRQFLTQKINLEGKKIQSRGLFQMTFQKAANPKFLRKIQKHQIITDYEIQLTQNGDRHNQLIPFGSQKIVDWNDQSSILEINTYENIRLHKFPMIQKRFIKTHQFSKNSSNTSINMNFSQSLCENGKFNKFFTSSKKIGQGAFGVVYSAKSILQGKYYAIKKLFIKSGICHQKMQTILKESIRQVNIVSQYNHPNIIRFHTCWLQMANLKQSMLFNKTNFYEFNEENSPSIINSSIDLNFKKKNKNQIQYSYISSQSNSGFAFQGSAKSNLNLNSFVKSSKSKQIISVIQEKSDHKQNLSEIAPIFSLYIQMELCNEGSLDRYLHNRKNINRNFAFIVFNQLLNGVHYLHMNDLIHRDLKPGNILINKKQRLIKIGDFGLSANINQQIRYGKIGTPSYIAPQVLDKKILRKQQLPLIDVYSVGVIYYQLLNLFNNSTKHQKLQKINKLKHGKVDLNNEYQLQKKLIKKMTRINNRPSIKQLFEMKEYLQLKLNVQKDKQIFQNWNQISGLQDSIQ